MIMNGKHTVGSSSQSVRTVPLPLASESDRDDATETIDFERVVFDPEYRASVRDALNRREEARRRRMSVPQ